MALMLPFSGLINGANLGGWQTDVQINAPEDHSSCTEIRMPLLINVHAILAVTLLFGCTQPVQRT